MPSGWDVVSSEPLAPDALEGNPSPWKLVSSQPLPNGPARFAPPRSPIEPGSGQRSDAYYGDTAQLQADENPAPSKPGFLDEAFVNPAKQLASGYFQSAAGGAHLLSNVAKGVGKVTGTKPGGAFENAEQYYRKKAAELAGNRKDIPSQIYRGAGSAPGDIAQYTLASSALGPVGGMAAVDAAKAADQGVVPALEAGAKGALTGGAFHVMAPATRPIKALAGFGMGAGESAISGGTPQDIAAGGLTMAGMAAQSPGTVGARDMARNARPAPAPQPPVTEALPTAESAPPVNRDRYVNNDALQELAQIETDPQKLALIQAAARQRRVPLASPEQVNAEQSAATLANAPERTPLPPPAPPPQVLQGQPSPAEQSARVFEQTLATQRAQAEAKAQKENVAVPETGVPEGVARGEDARERLAQKLMGKPFSELGNSDRITIDDLIAEGEGRSVQSPWTVVKSAPLPEPPAKHDYSSTQANLPRNISQRLQAAAATIPDEKLTEDGRENESHITVKFGLHGEDPAPVQNLLKNEPPITATLGKASLFSNEDADVLKVDIDSPDLHRLNAKIAEALPNTDTHPEYQPHATIAYLKPGEGKEYAGKDIPGVTGEKVILPSVTFSGKNGEKVEIPLNGPPPPAIGNRAPAEPQAAAFPPREPVLPEGPEPAPPESLEQRTEAPPGPASIKAEPEAPEPVEEPPQPVTVHPSYVKAAEESRLARDEFHRQNELAEKTELEPPEPLEKPAVPPMVASRVKRALDRLREIDSNAGKLEAGRRAYVEKAWRKGTPEERQNIEDAVRYSSEDYLKGQQPDIAAQNKIINEFRGHAKDKGIDADSWIKRELGAIPERFEVKAEPVPAERPLEKPAEKSTLEPDVRPVQRPASGESSALPEPRKPSREPAQGERTTIRAPGRDEAYQATYAVRELADTYPSHNPFTFERNPNYHHVNDRDYTDPLNQARVVNNSLPAKFDPAYLITDNPDATNGPSIIDSEGNVLGGNNRRMTLERVYRSNPGGAKAYRDMLTKKAPSFGIDPRQLAGMKQPVLVRELAERNIDSQRAITDFNKPPTAALNTAEKALADSRSITPDTAKYIGQILESAGPAASLSDVMGGKHGPTLVNRLIREGIFTEEERPSLLDSKTGAVTKLAKERVAKMLLGSLFEGSDQFQRAQPSLRNKLERLAPLLKQIEGSPEWDITPDIRKATSLIEYDREFKAAYGDRAPVKPENPEYAGQKQADMFGVEPRPEASPRAEKLAEVLRENSPTAIKKALQAYVEKSTEKSMFSDPDPSEEFDRIFGGESAGEKGSTPASLLTAPAAAANKALGLEATYERQLKPAADNLKKSWDWIQRTFNPGGRRESSEIASGSLRENTAHMQRVKQQVHESLKEARKALETLSPEARTAFIDRVEAMEDQPSTPIEYRSGVAQNLHLKDPSVTSLDQIAGTMAKVNQFLRNEVDMSDPETQRQWREAYWPNLWKETAKAKDYFGKAQPPGLGKKNLRGPRGFTKSKAFDTQQEGRDAGFTPLYDNPVDYWEAKAKEMAKFAMAKRMQSDLEPMRVYVPFGETKPEGYGYLNDPMGTVYGKPTVTVKEAYDQQMSDRLNELADNLGINHERKVSTGGQRLGYAEKGSGNIVTKFASPESVLAHEIGHQLEWKYNLSQLLKDRDYPERTKELTALADLRYEGQEAPDSFKHYVRNKDEKMANAIAALLYAPEKFKAAAPETWDFLRDELWHVKALRPLFDVQRSMVLGTREAEIPVGGGVIRGQYAYPQEAADVVNNYLSPGMREKIPLLNTFANLGNQYLRVKLLGPYHFATTGLNAIYSHVALAEKYIMQGDFKEAAAHIAKAPIAPVADAIRGYKEKQNFLDMNGTQTELTKALEAGGFRFGQDAWYDSNSRARLRDAWKAGERVGAIPAAIGTAVETLSAPIMQHYVPYLKMAAASDLARFELARMAKQGTETTPQQLRETMARAVDSVDNRFGQLSYDNLNWHKMAKELAMMSVISLGWNLGTVRELGGGAKDLAKLLAGKGPGFSHRLAYLIAMNGVHALGSMLYQYAMTGQGPQSVKDVMFPRNGETDESGRPARTAWPDYVKDEASWAHQPAETALGKLHPFPSEVAQLLSNRDSSKNKIRDENADWQTQLGQFAAHVAKEMNPISAGKAQQEYSRSGSLAKAAVAQVAGAAPAWVDRSKAEELMRKYQQDERPTGGRFRDARSDVQANITRLVRAGKTAEAVKLGRDSIAARTVTMQDLDHAVERAQLSPLVADFKRLDLPKALNVIEIATPGEKQKLLPVLGKELDRRLPTLPGDQQDKLLVRMRDLGLIPANYVPSPEPLEH